MHLYTMLPVKLFMISCLLIISGVGFCQSTAHIFSDTSRFAVMPADAFGIQATTSLNREELKQLSNIMYKMKKDDDTRTANKDFQLMPLRKYYYQLIATTNKKGEKEVLVKAFCNHPGNNWRKEIIEVQDGGNCYFSVTINLMTRQYSAIQMNGYAHKNYREWIFPVYAYLLKPQNEWKYITGEQID